MVPLRFTGTKPIYLIKAVPHRYNTIWGLHQMFFFFPTKKVFDIGSDNGLLSYPVILIHILPGFNKVIHQQLKNTCKRTFATNADITNPHYLTMYTTNLALYIRTTSLDTNALAVLKSFWLWESCGVHHWVLKNPLLSIYVYNGIGSINMGNWLTAIVDSFKVKDRRRVHRFVLSICRCRNTVLLHD